MLPERRSQWGQRRARKPILPWVPNQDRKRDAREASEGDSMPALRVHEHEVLLLQ